jgi:hypothetical protein
MADRTAWSQLLDELEAMPDELERALRVVPADRRRWTPASWGGAPGETFSALGHICHLRDIEVDGYHVRVQRLLDETRPSLVSLDGYQIARDRGYDSADAGEALSAFRKARARTVERLRGLSDAQLARSGDFAEYGDLTLRALVHYLRSHDVQHLAGIHWLAGKIASDVQP